MISKNTQGVIVNMNPNSIIENVAVNSRANYVRRGNFYGPLFDIDHLATFTVGSKLGTNLK